MKKRIEEQLRYLGNKRKYEKILRDKKLLKEGPLFDIIGDALGDIFKSLKLVAMDISNELRWIGEQFLYMNNPEKLADARADYKRKHDKLLKEWEPIVESSMDAIKNADPFMTIALSPGTFLATKGIQAGVAAGKNAVEIIAAEDWESIRAKMNKFQMDLEDDPDAGNALGMGAIYDQMREQNNLLLRLNDLFSAQAAERRTESLVYEQEDKDLKAPKITDPEKWLNTFFELTGIDEDFSDIAQQLMQGKLELIEKMIPTIESSIAVMKLVKTNDLNTFKEVISDIVQKAKIPAESVSKLQEIIPQIEGQASKLAQSDKFKQEIAKAENKAIEEYDEKELNDRALKVVFEQAKLKFDEQYKKDLADYIKVIESNHEEIDTDKQTLSLIKKRSDLPASKDFIKVYDQYDKAYKEFEATK
jgi:hypothetical protein